MRRSKVTSAAAFALVLALAGCAHHAPVNSDVSAISPVAETGQLVLVTTPAWDSTSGTLRRYERSGAGSGWHVVGGAVQIVVGRTGLAWDDGMMPAASSGPVKREGDGRSPAGAFALDTVFGFPARDVMSWVRLPYVDIQPGTECVDDVGSAHYNTIVDRSRLGSVDWTSAEHMRRIDQYKLGVVVAYNAAPPRKGRGSCIFLHIWAGPQSVTAGCTAMDERALEALVRWLDPSRRPMLVQLPASEMTRLRGAWGLP
jgi:D-alanyl-D-alanine dipeptidase